VNPRQTQAFHLWMQVCESAEVVKRAMQGALNQSKVLKKHDPSTHLFVNYTP